jgi:hypothetical protein
VRGGANGERWNGKQGCSRNSSWMKEPASEGVRTLGISLLKVIEQWGRDMVWLVTSARCQVATVVGGQRKKGMIAGAAPSSERGRHAWRLCRSGDSLSRSALSGGDAGTRRGGQPALAAWQTLLG